MKIEAKKISVEPPNDEFTNFQHPYFLAEEVKYKREAAEKAQKALSLEKWDEWKSEPTKIFDAVKVIEILENFSVYDIKTSFFERDYYGKRGISPRLH